MLTERKGFTIVELVIVIAVIAILASVMIPTFSNIITKAQKNNDLILIRNIQTILECEKILRNGVIEEADAIKILEENGISISDTSYADYKIAWDESIHSFVLKDSQGNIVEDNGGNNEAANVENTTENNQQTVPVTLDLTAGITFVGKETATLGSRYTATVKVPYEYCITQYCIKMGEDIFEESHELMQGADIAIDIPNVTGKIEITAKAIINQVRISKDLTGEYIYGNLENGYDTEQIAHGLGYIDNAMLSTSAHQNGICVSLASEYSAADGFVATGWMKLPWDQCNEIIVYIFIADGSLLIEENGPERYWFYEYYIDPFLTKDITEATPILDEESQNYLKLTLTKDIYGYKNFLRISVKGTGKNLIVTFNEPILPE